MKYVAFLLLILFFFSGCVATTVAETKTVVGVYSYQPVLKKIAENRKAECDKSEECKEPAPITDQDVLSVITGAKNHLEGQGLNVIGVEGEKFRIWFEKPVE